MRMQTILFTMGTAMKLTGNDSHDRRVRTASLRSEGPSKSKAISAATTTHHIVRSTMSDLLVIVGL